MKKLFFIFTALTLFMSSLQISVTANADEAKTYRFFDSDNILDPFDIFGDPAEKLAKKYAEIASAREGNRFVSGTLVFIEKTDKGLNRYAVNTEDNKQYGIYTSKNYNNYLNKGFAFSYEGTKVSYKVMETFFLTDSYEWMSIGGKLSNTDVNDDGTSFTGELLTMEKAGKISTYKYTFQHQLGRKPLTFYTCHNLKEAVGKNITLNIFGTKWSFTIKSIFFGGVEQKCK